ncbi:MAG: histidine kinase dimerization/phospho-acceptor domain-containing protein, partial [bacterium]
MTYYSISAFINATLSFLLGLYVLSRGVRVKLNQALFYWCSALGGWSICYFVWQLEQVDPVNALLWTRLLMVGAILVPITYFYLVITFLKIKKEQKIPLFLGIGLAVLFEVLLTTPLMVHHVESVAGFKFWPMPGLIYLPYLSYFFGYTIYSIYLSYKALTTASPLMKTQIKLMLFGIAVTIVGGSTNYFLWYHIPIKPYGNALAASYVIFTVYALMRHNLLNLRMAVTELFTSLIVLAMIINMFFFASSTELIVNIGLFLWTAALAGFTIKATQKELIQKEQLAKLNTNLKDLNLHLEDKVREQTHEIRRAYEVEKKARHDLEELDKAKTDFILTTQHHLRTPLTVVKGVLSMLRGKSETFSVEDREKFIAKADENTERLAKLVNEFLDISQMEVGKSIFDKKPTSIHPLVDDVLIEISHSIEQKNLKMEKSFTSEAKETTLSIDPKRFRDALTNLIDNAVKYTPKDGKITIHGEIALHPIEKTKIYKLTITDTGIGMTEEEKEKIFTRSFERG